MARASRFFTFLAAICSITMLGITVHSRADAFSYIQNGSFEDGAAGWHSGSLDLVTVDQTEVPPIAGQLSARITPDGGPFTVSQTLFDVTPGTYSVSVSVRRSVPGSQLYLRAQAVNPEGPGTNDLYASADVDTWIHLSGEVNLTTYSQVEVAVRGTGAGAIYIDDVRFEGAPPISATPTLPATATPPGSSTPVPTGTRSSTPTRTPSPTPTPTETTAPLIAGAPLRNGGFEDIDDSGMPVGWDRYGGNVSLVSDPVRSGQHAARLASTTDSTKWLYQTVAVVPGEAYAFDAWIADSDPAVASAWLRISWYESDDGSGAALATSDSTSRLDTPDVTYRYLTTDAVTAPDPAHSARFRVLLAPASAAAAAIYVDDAAFGPAEPSSPPATAVPVLAGSEDASDPYVSSQAGRISAVRSAARTGSAPGDTSLVPASSTRVVINEVLYDPSGSGADAANEWVELYNAGDSAVDLAGWTIADGSSRDALPELQLAPREFAVVAALDSFSKAYPSFDGKLAIVGGRIGNLLGNDGDRLILTDSSGAVVDAISWGSDTSVLSPAIPDVPAGHSIERRAPGWDTDNAPDFVDNESPSPGGPIAAPSTTAHPRAAADGVTIVSGAGSSFSRWLPWALTAAATAAMAAVLAWRAVPTLTQRLRTRA